MGNEPLVIFRPLDDDRCHPVRWVNVGFPDDHAADPHRGGVEMVAANNARVTRESRSSLGEGGT